MNLQKLFTKQLINKYLIIMKTNYIFRLLLLALLPFSVSAQITYNFDLGGNGYSADGITYTNLTQFPEMNSALGTFETKTLAELGAAVPTDGNTSIVFHGASRVSPTNSVSVDLTAFTGSDNQQVTWKTYFKIEASTSKGNGAVLRAQSTASGYSASVRKGYFFNCYGAGVAGSVKFRIGKMDANTSFTSIKSETTVAIPGLTTGPLHLKAKAIGSKLYFEYSLDGNTYTAFPGSPYTDATYANGTVQLAWALGSGSNLDQYFDDVVITNLDVPSMVVNGNNKYLYDGTNTAVKNGFDVNQAGYSKWVNQSTDAPVITYEFKGIGNTTYAQSATAPSQVGTYAVIGNAFQASTNTTANDTLAFEILTDTIDKYYTFTDDSQGAVPYDTYFSGVSHKVQPGVGSFLGYKTSGNMLQSVGNGITTLALFGNTDSIADNYAVIWKDYASAVAQKRGVILRGAGTNKFLRVSNNTTNVGQGYMFYVNNTTDSTLQLDIRKLHSDTTFYKSPQILITTTGNKYSGLNKATWFKAMAVDSVLTFEYSKDGINWTVACSAVDSLYSLKTQSVQNRYFSGTTQVSSINGGGSSYYFDYFLYKKLSKNTAVKNPYSESINLAINVSGGIRVLVSSYNIYNIQGVLIKSSHNSDENKIELLNPGVYIIKSGIYVQKVLIK